jgi:hypothetical protein
MSQVPPEVQQILLVTLNPLKCEASCWGYIAREVLVKRPQSNGCYTVWYNNCKPHPASTTLNSVYKPVTSSALRVASSTCSDDSKVAMSPVTHYVLSSSNDTSPESSVDVAAAPIEQYPTVLPLIHADFQFNALTPQDADPDVSLHEIEEALRLRLRLYQGEASELDLLDTAHAVSLDNLSFWTVLSGLFDPWTYVYNRNAFNTRRSLWLQHEKQLATARLQRLSPADLTWLLPDGWKCYKFHSLSRSVLIRLRFLTMDDPSLDFILAGPFEHAVQAVRKRQAVLIGGNAWVKPSYLRTLVEPFLLTIFEGNFNYVQQAADVTFGRPVTTHAGVRGMAAHFWRQLDRLHNVVSASPEGSNSVGAVLDVAPPCMKGLMAKAYQFQHAAHLKNDDRMLFGDFLTKCQVSTENIAYSWEPKMRHVYAPSDYGVAIKQLPQTLEWLARRMRQAPRAGITCNVMKKLQQCPYGQRESAMQCGRQCAARKKQTLASTEKKKGVVVQAVHSPVEYVQIMLTT